MSLTSYRAAPPRVNNVSDCIAQPGVLVEGFLTKSLGLLHPASIVFSGSVAQPGVLVAGFLTKTLGLLHPASIVFGLLNSAFVQDDGFCVDMYEGF